MKVQFTARALYDITEIGEFISRDNPAAADRVTRAIQTLAKSLSIHPRKGRKQRGKNLRKVGTPRYPYNIYYRVDDVAQVVLILNVRHAARRRGRRYQDT